ncbi:probable E3 SUMO-protein ligase RNF212 isoform X3 [Branchiostoma floridae]|uniref:Probable E3 SUMO-protein ligase RNF212 isoform X3 n=1 Tax=Branchiostoma floridae TaxID=7739 RepID=A0A9J7MTN4_BRAFL|nr:probable E3 SUMO-protein ligase RNF212 isoform X3 [Branchiostoma floridae]
MADWVHCNLCFRQPGDGKKFHLTNCGHIYCADCVMTGAKDRCKMCGGKCTTIILSAHMKPDVEIFFTDPAELAKKQHKQLLQVIDFQKNHRQRLTAYMREKDAKFSTEMKKVKQQMTLHVQEMESEMLRLRNENAELRHLLGGKPSTASRLSQRPVTTSPHPNMQPRVHRTPSPSHGPHKSPYTTAINKSLPCTPNMGDSPLSGNRTPTGPARITMRTPPIDGKMGTPPVVPGLTRTPTGQIIRAISNPGSHGDSGSSGGSQQCAGSPMSTGSSPRSADSRIASTLSMFATPKRQLPYNSPSSQPNSAHQGQPTTYTSSQPQSSQWDPSKRKIHLSYQPRSSHLTPNSYPTGSKQGTPALSQPQ